MTNRIAVGTPVTVKGNYSYPSHKGRNDLVVLWDNGSSYGVGPKGNDPQKAHDGANGWLGYRANGVTPKKESKTVTKFKEGDKVEVFQDGFTTPQWVGVQGIVKEVLSYRGYLVELTDPAKSNETVGYVAFLHVDNIKLAEAPKPFTFKDIQVGDTIRRTATYEGATEVREGVVGSKGSYYWANEQGNYILAYDTDDEGYRGVTLELLNRPEPEPVKEEWETAKAGDRLVVKNTQGVIRILTKQENDEWDCLIISPDGHSWRGVPRPTDAVKGQISNSGFSNSELQFIHA